VVLPTPPFWFAIEIILGTGLTFKLFYRGTFILC